LVDKAIGNETAGFHDGPRGRHGMDVRSARARAATRNRFLDQFF
jgi:hypothetical protein